MMKPRDPGDDDHPSARRRRRRRALGKPERTDRVDLSAYPDLVALLATQGGVATVVQLRRFLADRAIRRELDTGRWRRIGKDVIATHNGELTRDSYAHAALLRCPPKSALSGPTAALLAGFKVRAPLQEDLRIHVTLPCGRRTPKALGAEVHWSRFLEDVDVDIEAVPRRTLAARSILDWASWLERDDERAVRALILAAVQQRVTTPDELRAALARRGPCRHHDLIVESIDDAAGGIASVPEYDFTAIVRAGGLPEPSRQVVRRRPGGRYYLDVAWEDYGISAEIEGAQHFTPGARERDLERLNDLVIEGDRVLLFTSFAVRHRPDRVLAVLTRALESAGWRG